MAILTNKEVVEITYNGTALPMPAGGSAFIVVTTLAGATITVGSQTYTLGADETRHAFAVALGTHTVTVTKDGRTKSVSVVVSDYLVYFADMASIPRLPDAYQEVEWISSSAGGGQYIATSYYPVSASVFAFKFTPNNAVNVNYRAFGEMSYGDWTTHNGQCSFAYNTTTTGGNERMRLASTTQQGTDPEYTKSWDSGITPVSNTTYEFTNMTCCSTMLDAIYPMSIFCSNRLGYVSSAADCKIWYLTVTENGTKMAEWIPCYNKTSGVIGMYETVSGTFLTNAGSGTFTKGADVN